MSDFLYPLAASVVGVGFAAFLAFKVERALLRLNFKKSIYDECSTAAHNADQGIASAAATLRGLPVVSNRLSILAEDLVNEISDKETNEITQRMEQARADYLDSLREDIARSAESFAALYRKITMYDFALTKTQSAFQDMAKDYETYLDGLNESVQNFSSVDLAIFTKKQEKQAELSAAVAKSNDRAEAFAKMLDKLQALLRQELVLKLFK